jgi:hypothetical protein
MARKMRIPEEWLKLRPALKKTPHLYTIDQAVGLGAPNKPDDVLLIQYMLLKWEYTIASGVVTYGGEGVQKAVYPDVPVDGEYSLTTLGFIFMFQLKNNVSVPVNGRFEPISAKQLPSAKDAMVMLNAVLLDLESMLFKDFSTGAGVPGRLAQILKTAT